MKNKKNLRAIKIIYILIQALFLPLVWRASKLEDSGLYAQMWLVYAIYTALVLVDAVLGIWIFGRR